MAAADDHAGPAKPCSDPPLPTETELPPIESLNEDSDYTPFLAPEVEDQLRRLALRKLFHQPAFNVTDGLDDYAEDFAQHIPLGDLITHEMRSALERRGSTSVTAATDADAPATPAAPNAVSGHPEADGESTHAAAPPTTLAGDPTSSPRRTDDGPTPADT